MPAANSITVLTEYAHWRRHRLAAALRRAVTAALNHIGKKGALTILLAGDERVRALNGAFRAIDKSTNVLSFPAGGVDGYLGDIALAYGVCAREADEAGKTLADHAAHLAVHGTLHLAGYDHVRPREAADMEALETAILAKLGIADPYMLKSGRK